MRKKSQAGRQNRRKAEESRAITILHSLADATNSIHKFKELCFSRTKRTNLRKNSVGELCLTSI